MIFEDERARPEDQLDFVLHKLGHLAVYGVLAALVAWALDVPGAVRSRVLTVGVVVCLVYGASDELHQSLVVGRHPSAVDVGIDTLGALIGLAAYGFVTRKRPSRRPV